MTISDSGLQAAACCGPTSSAAVCRIFPKEEYFMSDDKGKKQPQDASKVNVNEQYEVEYWSKKFGVTPDQLRAAVSRGGPPQPKLSKT